MIGIHAGKTIWMGRVEFERMEAATVVVGRDSVASFGVSGNLIPTNASKVLVCTFQPYPVSFALTCCLLELKQGVDKVLGTKEG